MTLSYSELMRVDKEFMQILKNKEERIPLVEALGGLEISKSVIIESDYNRRCGNTSHDYIPKDLKEGSI